MFLNMRRNKNFQSKRKKVLNQMAAKLKMLNSQKLLLELLVAFLEPDQKYELELFVEVVNGIRLLIIFTKSSILDV